MYLKWYLGIIFIKTFAKCFPVALVRRFSKLQNFWSSPRCLHCLWLKVLVKWYCPLFWSNFMKSKYVRCGTMWLNFVFSLFFEQSDLLNLIILRVMRRDDLNVHVFQNRNWCSPKSDQWLSEDLSIGRIWIEKKFRGTGLSLALYAEPNERAEAATSSYSATGDFLQYIYFVVVAKNHQKIWSRCLVHEFFLQKYFLMILIMVTDQLYWRKILCGCFRFI